MNTCPLCLKPASRRALGPDLLHVSCQVCKEYQISGVAATARDLVPDEKRHILSGIVRNRFEQGDRDIYISTDNVKAILDSMSVPSDPLEAIDWLLKYLFRKTSKASEYVEWSESTDYPILFARDPEDFKYYIEKARELKLIEPSPNGFQYRLSLGGWRRLDELRKYERKSDQAFVAMWFKPDHPYLSGAYENGFKPALEETDYKPIRIDWVEHNEKICDMIIAEIRKSGLLVADVTGHRANVYFEVGFAMGLGIRVIWTCHNTDIEKLPFDTRQYNHIVWSDSRDLKERLIKRIEATLPVRPRKGLLRV